MLRRLAVLILALAPMRAMAQPGQAAGQGQPIPAERQAAAFLDRLQAGDLTGARAALPRNVRFGLHGFPEQLVMFRAATRGCVRGELFVSQFLWMDRSLRPRPPARPTRLSPDRLAFHRILAAGRPPADIGNLALSSNWDCPGNREDPVIYFYLLNDVIVRVAYDQQPVNVPG